MRIQVTSVEGEHFTWRAAGAREPRGRAAVSLVDFPLKVGDVLEAQLEYGLEGPGLVLVEKPALPERPARSGNIRQALVLAGVVPGGDPERGKRHKQGRSDEAAREDCRESGEGEGDSGRGAAEGKDEGGHEGPRGQEGTGARGPKAGARQKSPGRVRLELRSRDVAGKGGSPAAARPARRPSHLDEFLASLNPVERTIAQRLVKGGISEVKRALETQIKVAQSRGEPPPLEAPVLRMAEELLPRVRRAQWLDRVESLRHREFKVGPAELRRCIQLAVTETEEDKQLLALLRDKLAEALESVSASYRRRLERLLAERDVDGVLHAVSSPPDPAVKIPGSLAVQASKLVSEYLSVEKDPMAWLAVAEKAAESPLRATVAPVSVPEGLEGTLREEAVRLAGLMPGLAKPLGVRVPPPPNLRLREVSRRQ